MLKALLFKMSIPLLAMMLTQADGCLDNTPTPQSRSGVQKATTTVVTGPDGLTVEQRNVRDRLAMDNKPGSIKHLYIISAYSGQCLLYSTVKGKVTSSGKRLAPLTVSSIQNEGAFIPVQIGDQTYKTSEVLQDDGTYGSSVDYLYWWDVQGRYHQQYITGGMMVHISDQPIPMKSIIINLEATTPQ